MKLTEPLIPTRRRVVGPLDKYPNTLTVETILEEIERRVEGPGNYTLLVLEAFQTVTWGVKNWIEHDL